MNKIWSDLNKTMQSCLVKRDTFSEGIETLFKLRASLLEQIREFQKLSVEQMCAMPFMNAKGYHSKTIAYSLYHIFRIEDIVAHTIIQKDLQVFFKGDFQKRMNSPIATTGNELVKEEIKEFSQRLNLSELFEYIEAVNQSSTEIIKNFTFEQMKIKCTEEDKKAVQETGTVSLSQEAVWLIDYWCNKDIRGLVQMPFSRHWIMHIEAALRINTKV